MYKEKDQSLYNTSKTIEYLMVDVKVHLLKFQYFYSTFVRV